MNPRSRAIGALGVPIILPEISVKISDRNFGQIFEIEIFFSKKSFLVLKIWPKFLSEISTEISDNMMGTPKTPIARERGFMNFHEIFAEIRLFKVEQKLTFFMLLIIMKGNLSPKLILKMFRQVAILLQKSSRKINT